MFRVFKAYTYRADTHEFLAPCDMYTDETQDILPFNTEIKPTLTKKEGFAIVFNEKNQSWEYQEDHRGLVLFDTKTRQSFTIQKLGRVPEHLTQLEPKSEFDVWNGEKWVKDVEAENKAKINQLERIKEQNLFYASYMIAPLQDAVDLDMATDEEKTRLRAWKLYRVLMNRINISLEHNINWPEKPA